MSKYSVLNLAAKQHKKGTDVGAFLQKQGIDVKEFDDFYQNTYGEASGLPSVLDEQANITTPVEQIQDQLKPAAITTSTGISTAPTQSLGVSDNSLGYATTEEQGQRHTRSEPEQGYTQPELNPLEEAESSLQTLTDPNRPHNPASQNNLTPAEVSALPETITQFPTDGNPEYEDANATSALIERDGITQRTGDTTTFSGQEVLTAQDKQAEFDKTVESQARAKLDLDLNVQINEEADVGKVLKNSFDRAAELFPDINPDRYTVDSTAATVVKTATSDIATGLRQMDKAILDIDPDGVSPQQLAMDAFGAKNLTELSNAAAFTMASLAETTGSFSEYKDAIESDDRKAELRASSATDAEYEEKVAAIYEKEAQEGILDESARPTLTPQSRESLYEEGSTVSQAIKQVEAAMKAQFPDRQGSGDTSLAAAALLQSMVNQNYFAAITSDTDAEPRLMFRKSIAKSANSFTTINNLLFKSPRGETQSTPGSISNDAEGNGVPVPEFVGEHKRARVGQVISRVNGKSIPKEITSLATTQSAVQNFTHPGAFNIAQRMMEVLQRNSYVDGDFPTNSPLLKIANKLLNFKGSADNSSAYTPGDTEGEWDPRATFIYTSRSMDAMGKQLENGAANQIPHFNIFRIDPTSYRLYVPGGEFNYQGNTVIRNVSTGTQNRINVNTSGAANTLIGALSSKSDQGILSTSAVQGLFDWARGSKIKAPTATTELQAGMLALAYNLIPNSRFFSPKSVVAAFSTRELNAAADRGEVLTGITDPEAAAQRRIDYLNAKNDRSRNSRTAKRAWFYKANSFTPDNPIVQELQLAEIVAKGNANPDALTPEEQSALHAAKAMEMMSAPEFEKKTWGYTLKAYEAAFNLVDIHSRFNFDSNKVVFKPATEPWVHNLEVEADMTSAGRTFAAMNTGTKNALEAGAWARTDAYDDESGFLFPDGTARTNATDTMVKTLKDADYALKDEANMELNATAMNLSEVISLGRAEVKLAEIREVEQTHANELADIRYEYDRTTTDPTVEGRAEYVRNNRAATDLKLSMAMTTINASLGKLKKFDDALMKSGLLTKDYGETVWNNSAAVAGLLKAVRKSLDDYLDANGRIVIPEGSTLDASQQLYANIYNNFTDTNNENFSQKKWDALWDHYYRETITQEIDPWGSEVPKAISRGLSMIGRIPVGKDFFGNLLSLGQMGLKPKLKGSLTVGGQLIAGVESVNDATAASDKKAIQKTKAIIRKGSGHFVGKYEKDKDGKIYAVNSKGKRTEVKVGAGSDYKVVNTEYYVGDPGSAAASAVGPALGQAAETSWFAWMDQHIDKKSDDGWYRKRPEMYQKYVFDNVSADPITALLYEANAKRGMLEVMSKNVAADFVNVNMKSLEDGVRELRDAGGRVEVGYNSQFSNLHSYLQSQFKAYEKSRLLFNDGNKSQKASLRSKGERLLKFYNQGLWTPDADVKLEWFDSYGQLQKHELKGKGADKAKETRLVSSAVVADAIKELFLKPLYSTKNQKGGLPKWKQFRNVVNNQHMKPALLEALYKGESGWMKGGLG